MRQMIILLLFIVSMAAGCSILDTVGQDQNRLAVQYATMKVVDQDQAKAQRIIELVEQAKGYVNQGSEVTITYLADEAQARLAAANLDPADQLLAQEVLNQVETRLKERIGDGLLDEQQRIKLITVLNWIEDAARGYATSP